MTRMSKRRSVEDARDVPTNRLNVKIPSSAYDRLIIHALLLRKSPGEVVAELIEGGLKGWAMPAPLADRSRKSSRQESAPELNPDAPALPLGMTG